jgi:hypothetical protein
MAAPVLRPCLPFERLPGCCDIPDDTNPDLVASLEQQATEILWVALGRRFGLCEHRVRPCRRRCRPADLAGYRFGDLIGYGYDAWSFLDITCSCPPNNCGCTRICQLALPGPVAAVTEVIVDGVVLDPEQYRVDDFRYLVRVPVGDEDRGVCWPECQDFSLAADQPGTWEVTYTRGRPTPELVKSAMSALVCELYKLCTRDASCVLPRNMATMTRQGVTIRFQGKDATNAIIEFVPEVALAVRTFNPRGLQSESRVFRADAPGFGRRVGT